MCWLYHTKATLCHDWFQILPISYAESSPAPLYIQGIEFCPLFPSGFSAGTQTGSEQAEKLRRQHKDVRDRTCYTPCRNPLHFSAWLSLALKGHRSQSSCHNFTQSRALFFFSLSQWKFPARTNTGLHSPANIKFLDFCAFLCFLFWWEKRHLCQQHEYL